ncbi:MAG: leucine-rich repeat domain-containing protein [Candidatus Gastranaerophilales bacterium]|nr:leucine-rich repeat domain-containing protein [Candidatus Gastranaerophilales bacterium]
MRKRRRLCGVLMIIAALVVMQLPVSEADAASSASDFQMEGTTLVRYRGMDSKVMIPATVEAIGESAFENNDRIELVVVPDSIEEIGRYAFWGCDNLDTVTLGKGLTEIGDYTFANCQGLTQMSIPGTVTRIGNSAFENCVNLMDITIPFQVSDIHETAFDGCYKLTIHYESGSFAEEYAKVFYRKQQEMPEYQDVVKYQPEEPDTGSTETDNENTNNGNTDNGNEGQNEITIPVTPQIPETPGTELGTTHVVGNQAVVFLDNTLPQVLSGGPLVTDGGSGLPKIGADLLSADGSMIPKFTIVDGQIVADQAYYRNEGLQAVALSEGVRQVGQFAFARSSISQVYLPEGVEVIGYGAFYHCDNLEEVSLPSTLTCVEPKAFTYSPWVERFLAGEGGTDDFLVSGGTLIAYRGTGGYVVIPEGVTLIAAEVFQGHDEITGVTFPESLRVIGEGAFENCGGLRMVAFGGQITDIKDRAFAGTVIEQANLPASLERIGLQAFPDAANVTYGGEQPETTHELTAERLSNEVYRLLEEETEQAGVTMEGMDGADAQLDGAVRHYTLSIWEVTDAVREEVAHAFLRNLQQEMPEDIQLYEMSMTDNSGIPISKTGKQMLTVTLPVPERFADMEVQMVVMDRNGQLEYIQAERLLVDGVDCVRFATNYLSVYGMFGSGDALDKEGLIEVTTTLNDMAAPPAEVESVTAPHLFKWILGGLMLLTGAALLIASPLKRR